MSTQTLSLTICHLYPELLNLYGDSGNILVLKKRAEWRGIKTQVNEVHVGETAQFSNVDIVLLGGGSDREQKIVCDTLLKQREALAAYVEQGGVLAAVCGGYQLLGKSYLLGNETIPGLNLIDFYTTRKDPRLIGNIVIKSPLVDMPVVGYENHAGRTHLGAGVKPFGEVIYGHGNDGQSGQEGCVYKNVVGTYIHGPLLPKNPQLADWLILRALQKKYPQDFVDNARLAPLDDTIENAANTYMYERLMHHEIKEQ